MITIYGLDECKACQDAIDICEKNGFKYHYYLATEEKVATFTKDTKAPFILVDDQYIGSLDQFRTWIDGVNHVIDAVKVYLKGDVHVEFKKVDGTIKTMHCTQNFDLIPVEHHPSETSDQTDIPVPRKKKDSFLLTVYDLEAKGWRSIRAERIIRYS